MAAREVPQARAWEARAWEAREALLEAPVVPAVQEI